MLKEGDYIPLKPGGSSADVRVTFNGCLADHELAFHPLSITFFPCFRRVSYLLQPERAMPVTRGPRLSGAIAGPCAFWFEAGWETHFSPPW